MIKKSLSNNPSSGDINSSSLPCSLIIHQEWRESEGLTPGLPRLISILQVVKFVFS